MMLTCKYRHTNPRSDILFKFLKFVFESIYDRADVRFIVIFKGPCRVLGH